MADERKNSLLDSPLYGFVKRGWKKWSQGIVTVQAGDEDFLLYLQWTLDSIKSQEDSVNSELWDNLYNALRDGLREKQFNTNQNDLVYLTNLTCASALACLGLALDGSPENKRIFSELVSGFDSHWKDIQKLKYGEGLDASDPELKVWAVEYFSNDDFYTYSDVIEWNNEDMEAQLIRRNKDFDKVDLFRVVMALYELDAFESVKGSLSKKKVFQAFGEMLGEDYSDFSNHLSAGSTTYKESIDIFQRLEAGLEQYETDKDKKLTKQGKPKRRI